jgi:hypothetical protein
VAFERSGSFLSRIERIVAPAIARAPANGADLGDAEDDATEREVDAVMAAGDESRDGPPPQRGCRVGDPGPGASTPGPEPVPSAADIGRLVSGLSVQRTANGGLVIEAPPETASTLAALFSGMAQLLQAAAAPTIPPPPKD